MNKVSETMKTDQSETLTKELREVQRDVDGWLRFAEQKNAGIVVFSAALVVGILDVGLSAEGHGPLLILSVVFVLIGVGISLSSSVPYLDLELREAPKKKKNPNLLFYGDIAAFTGSDYLSEYCNRYAFSLETSKLQEDLCSQITANAKIANLKFRHFTTSILPVALGLSLFVIYVVATV